MGLFNIRSHLTVSIKWLTWQLLIPGSLARRTSQHNCSCCTCQLIPDNNLRRQFVVLNGKKNWQQSPLPCYCVLTGGWPIPPEHSGLTGSRSADLFWSCLIHRSQPNGQLLSELNIRPVCTRLKAVNSKIRASLGQLHHENLLPIYQWMRWTCFKRRLT